MKFSVAFTFLLMTLLVQAADARDDNDKRNANRKLAGSSMMMPMIMMMTTSAKGKGKGAPVPPPPPPAPKNYHPCGYPTDDPVSPNGVVTLSPEGGIIPTATWSLGTRAGDFVYVAGMRGIDPTVNALVPDDLGRVRQAFVNMQLIAASEGASLFDAVRLVVYVTDMYRFRPLVNQIQSDPAFWGEGPYPPRTIIEVDRLNQDDIVEVEGTFYAPCAKE